MATTNTPSGSLSASCSLQTAFGGDTGGSRSVAYAIARTFAAAQALPTIGIAGFLSGRPVGANGDWLIAHATDPFQGQGDSVYSDGLVPAGKSIKGILIENLDATNSVTVKRGAVNGLPFLDTAGAGIVLTPGGLFLWLDPAGTVAAALATGSNDKVTLTVSGGTPQLQVVLIYA